MSDGPSDFGCRELVEFVADYLVGELEPRVERRFAAHLAACPACAAYLRTYEDTVALARACADDDRVPADVPEGLVRAILAARRAD